MVNSYLAQFISIFAQIFIFAIFARVVMSFLRVPVRGYLFTLIVESTEPILSVFRRIVPPIGGVLDISPILAYFAIDLTRGLLVTALS